MVFIKLIHTIKVFFLQALTVSLPLVQCDQELQMDLNVFPKVHHKKSDFAICNDGYLGCV